MQKILLLVALVFLIGCYSTIPYSPIEDTLVIDCGIEGPYNDCVEDSLEEYLSNCEPVIILSESINIIYNSLCKIFKNPILGKSLVKILLGESLVKFLLIGKSLVKLG